MKTHDRLLKHCGSFATLAFVLLLLSRLTHKARGTRVTRTWSSYFSAFEALGLLVFGASAWLQRDHRCILGRPVRALPAPAHSAGVTALSELGLRVGSSPPSPSGPSRVGSVRFDPLIAVMTIPCCTELATEKREHLWWQPDDFVNFLRTRLDIAEAYKAAAHSLGVEMFNVCSVGDYAKAAYQATIETYPGLKDESRRGLGLGRRNQRARNRDAYLAAVVNEQGRQKQLGLHDPEALASVARAVSRKDREYAHFLAQMYYEQDHADEYPENGEVQTPSDQDNSDGSPRRSSSLRQIFWEEAEESSSSRCCPSSKGFGLTREKLREVGLSATGHVLSKTQRCQSFQPLNEESGSDFE